MENPGGTRPESRSPICNAAQLSTGFSHLHIESPTQQPANDPGPSASSFSWSQSRPPFFGNHPVPHTETVFPRAPMHRYDPFCATWPSNMGSGRLSGLPQVSSPPHLRSHSPVARPPAFGGPFVTSQSYGGPDSEPSPSSSGAVLGPSICELASNDRHPLKSASAGSPHSILQSSSSACGMQALSLQEQSTSNDSTARRIGNCSPRYMSCSLNQIPCSADRLSKSGMQLSLLVQPLAIPCSSEDPISIIDFGDGGPVRCSRCKGYINPFMKFINLGRHFICNLCGYTNETPKYYYCNLGPDGRRRDADERPELCQGTVEFVAPNDKMMRETLTRVYFFLIDVSLHAIKTGAAAAACFAISQVISDLPVGAQTKVGIATFDSTVHFYNLSHAVQQPVMLVVPDVQDVYAPLESATIIQLAECREHLKVLLENIPIMFQNNRIADSAFGAAMKAAFLVMKKTGGKLLTFQSVLPTIGIGSLSGRAVEGKNNISAGSKEPHKLLQPLDGTLRTMGIEFAEHQVSVDLFISTQSYVDIASLSVISRTTGGQVYYYYPFSDLSDSMKLYNDLRWNVTRQQGFEAVMRVRCSQGIQVQDYFGNFCRRIPSEVDLPAIDCDKAIMVTLKHDSKLQEKSVCSFQCALLYTSVWGQRKIRVSNLSLPCTDILSGLFRSADLETHISCISKQVAYEIPSVPLAHLRDQVANACIDILYSYRKFCTTGASHKQLVLPEKLSLLPLFILALLKSNGLRSDGSLDDRSFWMNYISALPTSLLIPFLYPRMISIHDIHEKEPMNSIPSRIPLSSEHISDEGIYLLENGIDCLIFVGGSVQRNLLYQFFGVSSVEEISNQYVLKEYDNPLSKKLSAILNEIRVLRCSYLRLRFCRRGDSSGMMFFSHMVEDQMSTGPSYYGYLMQIQSQVQSKLS